MTEPLITIKNVRKVYPKNADHRRIEVLHDINLTIHKGEFLILLGPSGCGKSTLLRIISGLDKASGGTIEHGKSFNKDNISFVFQNFGILPWLSIRENVALNLIGKGMAKEERDKEVSNILDTFGLGGFKDRYPHELSGGMKQRVGLARAFVAKPEIVFLDEPFSELDFFTAKSLRDILLEMWQKHGTTVVMVSHYIDEAVALADRIAVFSDRPSSILKVVANDLPRPRKPRSEAFFKREDEVLGFFEEKK
jgi:NitT/TauT family transport system ATP-binding protein